MEEKLCIDIHSLKFDFARPSSPLLDWHLYMKLGLHRSELGIRWNSAVQQNPRQWCSVSTLSNGPATEHLTCGEAARKLIFKFYLILIKITTWISIDICPMKPQSAENTVQNPLKENRLLVFVP